MAQTLRLILGDQLNSEHSWFKQKEEHVCYLMAEIRQETDYVKHHIQKIAGFFAAMRSFAKELEQNGHRVVYIPISENKHESFDKLITEQLELHNINRFEYLEPDEYRLDAQLKNLCTHFEQKNIATHMQSTEHFMTQRDTLSVFFEGKKQALMESFYRMMRKKSGYLMLGDQPEGGKWNYDGENRSSFKDQVPIPPIPYLKNDIKGILDEIQSENIQSIGAIEVDNYNWPINREQGLALLQHFCENLLPYFGKFQDALYSEDPFLFHSRLSFALNLKMISPKEVIERSIEAYHQDKDAISLAQIEGFVRQILGWREYMRGMYWREMPEYADLNALEHHRPLPSFYWTGKTKMKCLEKAISQSLKYSYAHHIQRLMVTGNFALLTQINPDQLDEWYLGIYIDAIEWVEMPNTRGMSQYADFGKIATKPYISSANYIDKMSNYCKGCHYNAKAKKGEDSCPFNSLYWNFLDHHRAKLSANPRMGMMYRLLDKKNQEEMQEIRNRASKIIENPDLF